MTKYTYSTIKDEVEAAYLHNAKVNVYTSLGDVDFSKIYLVVEAADEKESEAMRKAVTDIRMWELYKIED